MVQEQTVKLQVQDLLMLPSSRLSGSLTANFVFQLGFFFPKNSRSKIQEEDLSLLSHGETRVGVTRNYFSHCVTRVTDRANGTLETFEL